MRKELLVAPRSPVMANEVGHPAGGVSPGTGPYVPSVKIDTPGTSGRATAPAAGKEGRVAPTLVLSCRAQPPAGGGVTAATTAALVTVAADTSTMAIAVAAATAVGAALRRRTGMVRELAAAAITRELRERETGRRGLPRKRTRRKPKDAHRMRARAFGGERGAPQGGGGW